MIRVRIRAVPASLQGPTSAGETERAKALAFYALATNREKSFPFGAYRGLDVVEALEQEFHRKCAYCEWRYDPGAPMEVEHYRPKGGVVIDGQLRKPGYFWLAADWTNLLPSCIDCNRRRYQKFDGLPRELAGKANLFPVADEARRATAPGGEANEPRLLLHPRLDDPRRHLEFLPKGGIRERADRHGAASEMGRASIEVYGLRRRGLAAERRDRQVAIEGSLTKLSELRVLDAEVPGNARVKHLIDLEIATLRGFVAKDAIFSAMARQMIGPLPRA